jgi:hypothetical protein
VQEEVSSFRLEWQLASPARHALCQLTLEVYDPLDRLRDTRLFLPAPQEAVFEGIPGVWSVVVRADDAAACAGARYRIGLEAGPGGPARVPASHAAAHLMLAFLALLLPASRRRAFRLEGRGLRRPAV